MRVKTSNALIFDMGLTGREVQDEFSAAKYKAMVGGNPQGRELIRLADEHWSDWLIKVSNAPWLRNWQRSQLYSSKVDDMYTPLGRKVGDSRLAIRHNRIAEAIYATAVWGFGMDNWLNTKNTQRGPAMQTILKMQRVRYPNAARTYMWDGPIYRGCGIFIPCEYGDLDRWLAPLWEEATSSK